MAYFFKKCIHSLGILIDKTTGGYGFKFKRDMIRLSEELFSDIELIVNATQQLNSSHEQHKYEEGELALNLGDLCEDFSNKYSFESKSGEKGIVGVDYIQFMPLKVEGSCSGHIFLPEFYIMLDVDHLLRFLISDRDFMYARFNRHNQLYHKKEILGIFKRQETIQSGIDKLFGEGKKNVEPRFSYNPSEPIISIQINYKRNNKKRTQILLRSSERSDYWIRKPGAKFTFGDLRSRSSLIFRLFCFVLEHNYMEEIERREYEHDKFYGMLEDTGSFIRNYVAKQRYRQEVDLSAYRSVFDQTVKK